MNTAYLSLGSNEGDRTLWLQKAIDLIETTCGAIIKKSSVYETAAWGITTQPDFLNMVVNIQTTLLTQANSIINECTGHSKVKVKVKS